MSVTMPTLVARRSRSRIVKNMTNVALTSRAVLNKTLFLTGSLRRQCAAGLWITRTGEQR